MRVSPLGTSLCRPEESLYPRAGHVYSDALNTVSVTLSGFQSAQHKNMGTELNLTMHVLYKGP